MESLDLGANAICIFLLLPLYANEMTVDEFQKYAWSRLAPLYAEREVRAITALFMETSLGWSPTEMSLRRREELAMEQLSLLQTGLQRLEQHEPVQYVTGTAYFWGLSFRVAPGVLIPRQETEELVDWVIKDNPEKELKVLDIGTGSGCISISLAKERPQYQISALDFAPEALNIAYHNAERHGSKILFLQKDILQASPEDAFELDIIISNPPYIKESEKADMRPHVLAHEPEAALFVPDDDALLFYRKIAELGIQWLRPGGKLYFEINEALGKEVVALLKALSYDEVVLRKDLNGKDRMVRAKRGSEL